MRRVALMVVVLGFVPLCAVAQTEDAQSRSLPWGPPPANGYQSYDEARRARGQKVIAGVPVYLWHHGCGPTAAGMVVGYWDGHGFPLLIPGDTSTQTEAVNQAIASTAHYDDYSLPIDQSPDPIQPDKSTLGGAHAPHNCLGDFMNTSWSSRSNYYGWSWFSDVDDSLLGYTNTFVHNTYGAFYTATATNETWGAFTWADFQAQINADRPMVFLVDSSGDGQTDHFVPAIGYRDTSGYPEYACFDTWYTAVRWERFRAMSASYSWGIFGATFFGVQGTLAESDSMVAWGYNYDGQCNVPAPNSGFVAVAGGWCHSLGLKADGPIVAWGGNSSGQCNVPAPNTDFVSVAAGYAHSLGLKADGSIVAWGGNYQGQCNVPVPNNSFVAVAAGYDHSLGLKADGSIVAWGYNGHGQCNVPALNTDFVAVAGGGFHSLGLKAGGSIVAWGLDDYGQCNVPAPNSGFVAVAASGLHSLGLEADGSIVAWGKNDHGQCNVPAPNSGFVAIAAGVSHSLGLKPYARADLNCDGTVDFGDISPFVLALSNPGAYGAHYPDCNILNGDCDGDGDVDFDDINSFVALLSGS